jgi:dolichyl-phosphate-mannose--protein O-mannosyl transferase
MKLSRWFIVALVAAVVIVGFGVWQLQRGNLGGWVLIAGAAMQLTVAWYLGYRPFRKGVHEQ